MPTVNIIFQQSNDNNLIPGSRDDIVLNLPVTALNQNPTGITSYLWQFIDTPMNSMATIDFPTNSVIHFTPDIIGTYLIKLVINAEISATSAAAIKTANLQIRLPAAGEIVEFGIKGWSRALDTGLKILDDGYGNIAMKAINAVQLSPSFQQNGFINISSNGSFAGDIQILEALDTFGPSTLKIGTGTFGSTSGILIGQPNINTIMQTDLGMIEGKAIRLENILTTNWSIGKNLSLFTKTLLSSSSMDFVIADSLDQGFAIGTDGGNSVFEVRSDGYAYLLNSFLLNGNLSINGSNYIQFDGPNDFNWRQGINISYIKQNVGTDFSGNTLDILLGAGTHDGFTIGNIDGYSILEIDKNGTLYIGVVGNDCAIDAIEPNGNQNLILGQNNAGNILIGNTTHSTIIGVAGITTHLNVNPNTIGMISSDGLEGVSVTNSGSISIWSPYGLLVDGYIAPVEDSIYNLGDLTKQWKDGYFSGKLVIDGYQINLSNGVNYNDIIVYDGASFVARPRYGGQQVINSSGDIVIDSTIGDMCMLGSTDNISSITISDGQFGQIFTLDMFQGNSSYTWPTTINNARLSGGNFIKSSTIQNIDTITFRWNNTKTRWDEISRAMLLS